jgi:hypothetical protein
VPQGSYGVNKFYCMTLQLLIVPSAAGDYIRQFTMHPVIKSYRVFTTERWCRVLMCGFASSSRRRNPFVERSSLQSRLS